MFIKIIGLLAAACTTFALLPQVIKTIRTKRTQDISLQMYILIFVGNLLWLTYGIGINDFALISANVVTSVFSFTILILKLKYK